MKLHSNHHNCILFICFSKIHIGCNSYHYIIHTLVDVQAYKTTKSLLHIVDAHFVNALDLGIQLPGFYYDREKKKYFRLLPGHNNYNPVTVDSLRKKELEKQKILVSGDKRKVVTSGGSTCQRSGKAKRMCGCNLPFPNYHHNLQLGTFSSQLSERLSHEKVIELLKLRPHSVFGPKPFDELTGTVSTMQADHKNDKLALVLKTEQHTLLWVSSIVPDRNDVKNVCAGKWKIANMFVKSKFTKVTNLTWTSHRKEEHSQLLLSYIGGPSSTSGVQVFRLGDSIEASSFCIHNSILKDTAWTCAWSNNDQYANRISVGLSRKAMIIDIATRNKTTCFTHNSDVFAQTFAVQSPVLFNGTRRGLILGSDLRAPNTDTSKGVQLKHSSSVCHLQLLQDENYLVSSDMASKILLWDLRSLKTVLEYEGHSNDHLHIPFHIDSTETVLYAGGMDTFVRFWSLKDGHKLTTIPSPQGVASTPIVQYSSTWSEQNIPGMLMANEKGLNWYTV
ncbi:DDB1- and CUL4-associated factor 4-like [Ptychodera flava]|uniref:DDB1- and CUL4-associated factor 4-like n=1 Tax=Ptychodera flava TaxID=63121 RepID=UPI00396A8790